MTETLGLRRLRRTLLIHRLIEGVLVIMLLAMALYFFQMFAARDGNLRPFYNSLIATLLVQVALFFPIRAFTIKEARRELGIGAKATLTDAEKNQLRSQRLLADFIKVSVFVFFLAFIISAPPAGFVLSTSYFCCIGTILNYLQNFNFAVRRQMTCEVG